MSRRIVVLVSGSGTNLQALIDANLPNASIVLVVSNRKAAYGLTRAASANPPIPTAYLALQPFLKNNPGKTRTDYDAEIAKIVRGVKPDLVVLAGWMHVFAEGFLEPLQTDDVPVINLHPALPGAFDGAHAIERAFQAFQAGEITEVGVMVHRVVKEVDRGEPVLVKHVDIRKDDTLEQFESRLHKVEWTLIVEATVQVLNHLDRKKKVHHDTLSD